MRRIFAAAASRQVDKSQDHTPGGSWPLRREYARPARDWWQNADEGKVVFTLDDLNSAGIRRVIRCRNAIVANDCLHVHLRCERRFTRVLGQDEKDSPLASFA